MRRWLWLSIGIGIALAALYALLTVSPGPSDEAARRASPSKPGAAGVPTQAAHEEIDARSRAELRETLRNAEEGAP